MKDEIAELLAENNTKDEIEFVLPDHKGMPHVIMVVGGMELEKQPQSGSSLISLKSRKKVMLGAADTFRAAAVDQLDIWSKGWMYQL